MKTNKEITTQAGSVIAQVLCLGMFTLGISATSVQADVIIDDFQSYTAGSNLPGQGPWLATPPSGTVGTGITVEALGGGVQVAQFADNTSSTLGVTLVPPAPASGTNTFSLTARESAITDPADASGFYARLDSGVGLNSALDPFFQVGFSAVNSKIQWLIPGVSSGSTADNTINVGDWYTFNIQYDISHTTLGNNNFVQLTVFDLTTSTQVTSQTFNFANQNGGRTVLGAVDFVTGSTNADSTYQLDNVAYVPEPSATAYCGLGLGGLFLALSRRHRRRAA